jgi:hypothetical protein
LVAPETACELLVVAEVLVAWLVAAVCAPTAAGSVFYGGEVNGVSWVAAAELPA